MNRAIPLILTLVMLAHSLAGCCGHHAHAAGAEVADQCCERQHDHDGDANQDGHDGVPKQQCNEGSCLFLRDGGSSVDFGLDFAHCWATLDNHTAQHALKFAGAVTLDAESVALPARLHLLHQILLI